MPYCLQNQNDLHACRIHIFTPSNQFVKQADSDNPVKIGKPLIWKKSAHTASYIYTIDNWFLLLRML